MGIDAPWIARGFTRLAESPGIDVETVATRPIGLPGHHPASVSQPGDIGIALSVYRRGDSNLIAQLLACSVVALDYNIAAIGWLIVLQGHQPPTVGQTGNGDTVLS
ncbi:hypothetical protein D3C76_1345880 [compost metagenome]